MLIICAQNNGLIKVITDDEKREGEEIIIYKNANPILINIQYEKDSYKNIMSKLYDKYSQKEVFNKKS